MLSSRSYPCCRRLFLSWEAGPGVAQEVAEQLPLGVGPDGWVLHHHPRQLGVLLLQDQGLVAGDGGLHPQGGGEGVACPSWTMAGSPPPASRLAAPGGSPPPRCCASRGGGQGRGGLIANEGTLRAGWRPARS